MNWYKTSQKILPSLLGLAHEALKYDSFEEFERAYCTEIKHGQYWHFTDNPNFTVNPELGPRDMSSMAMNQEISKGKLMITSNPDEWDSYYNGNGKTRPYAVEVDMSQVPKDVYRQVNRGFGNEFFVDDISKVKVLRILPVENARRIWRRTHCKIPGSADSLREFYENAWKLKKIGKL